MNGKVRLPADTEYTVSVENIKFHLLITEQSDCNQDENKSSRENMPPILHDHVSSEVFAAVKRKTKICSDRGDVLLSEGDVAIVPPGIRHAMSRSVEPSETAVLSFICDKGGTRGTVDLYSELKPFFVGDRISIYRGVPEFCERIKRISEAMNDSVGVLPAIESVALLLEVAKMGVGTAENESVCASEQYDIKRMMQLDNIIGGYYMYNLKMSDVAEQLFISSRQLDRIARKRYGKTLHKVIMEKRVKEAEKLLTSSDMTVDKIGGMVGFSSSSGFCREFCAVYGVTPSEYRKIEKSIVKA